MDDEPRGRVDLVSVLYILGGIPALIGFVAVVFTLSRACNLPA